MHVAIYAYSEFQRMSAKIRYIRVLLFLKLTLNIVKMKWFYQNLCSCINELDMKSDKKKTCATFDLLIGY
jgi:hypothetical protein